MRWGLVALLCAALAPMPGIATSHRIEVFSNEFIPEVVLGASPGPITWEWKGGSHTVTAYGGLSFDSGVRSQGATYTHNYSGGTVKYRCVLHSSLTATQECSGMCGYITDQSSLDITKPSVFIEQPSAFVVAPKVDTTGSTPRHVVTISGSATDDVGVFGVGLRIYDTTSRVTEVPFTNCPRCRVDAMVTWWYDAALLPGSYVVEAIASDLSGNTFVSQRRQFVLL